jgi:acyl-CoA thioester hydrolase
MAAPERGRTTARKPPFKYAALERVGFSDTDAQGVVYYGRYMPYFDLAWAEYHRNLALLRPHAQEHQFAMRACAVEYVAPARFDDLIEIFVRVARIGTTSVTCEFAAFRVADDLPLVTARQTLVLIDADVRRPQPVPSWYRDVVRAFEGDDLDG